MTTATTHHDVIVVGTGFAGLGMAIKLKEAGEDDFVVLEKAQSVGGTWRENTYPGCACDVQSHLYSFSFEPNPTWSRMFASQPEIRAYLEHCTDKYGVRPHLRFDSEITSAEYDEALRLWRVVVNGGERRYTARVLVAGFGPLSRPELPSIDGVEEFGGDFFHSAQWRSDVELAGKRVAVIGTGASAIQFVPRIASQVGELKLFQRTAPWVLPKPDRPTTGIERGLFRRMPALQKLYRELIYWRLETRVLGMTLHPKVMKAAELVGKLHIRRSIKDPVLRALLTPDYTIGCKRILMSNDYYSSLDRPNVSVISGGIARVTPTGVIDADGNEHEVDVIIYGTGFKVRDPLGSLQITGRDGAELGSLWRERGLEAYLGTTIAGFPNLFLLVGPNTGLGHNSIIYMIESQVHYVLDAIATMRRRQLAAVDVRPDVQGRFNDDLQAQLAGTVWSSGCSSWYLDESGKNRTLWPGFTFAFRQATDTFDIEEYEAVA
ncbi:MAG TPA: NAD(P)/FAD-dependent oxidoreductase [Solirubrobacteraceae bacterium]|nr:NAD(P)/FAD-dependent oxidoreductase [Solirubrobacteraceae bacterium]